GKGDEAESQIDAIRSDRSHDSDQPHSGGAPAALLRRPAMEGRETGPGQLPADGGMAQAERLPGRGSRQTRETRRIPSGGSQMNLQKRPLMSRLLAVALLLLGVTSVRAQPLNARIGEGVPRDVRELYDKGLQYLVKTQTESGEWTGGQAGPGVTG